MDTLSRASANHRFMYHLLINHMSRDTFTFLLQHDPPRQLTFSDFSPENCNFLPRVIVPSDTDHSRALRLPLLSRFFFLFSCPETCPSRFNTTFLCFREALSTDLGLPIWSHVTDCVSGVSCRNVGDVTARRPSWLVRHPCVKDEANAHPLTSKDRWRSDLRYNFQPCNRSYRIY